MKNKKIKEVKIIDRERYIISIISMVLSIVLNRAFGTFNINNIAKEFFAIFFLINILLCLMDEVELLLTRIRSSR